MASELHRRFSSHVTTAEQHQNIEHFRSLCHNLAVTLDNMSTNPREKAIAITKLEEVMFWGVASIARPPSATEPAAPKVTAPPKTTPKSAKG